MEIAELYLDVVCDSLFHPKEAVIFLVFNCFS